MNRFIMAGLLGVVALAAAGRADEFRKQTGAKVYSIAPGDADQDVVALGANLPKYWLGIRVTPVPAALASHIGRGGIMVGNLFKSGPADGAGLQRFDVIVSLNGEAVEQMDDLVEAVAANGDGKPATLVVLRAGQEMTLSITPAQRLERGPFELKFDEPKDDREGDVRAYAHRLERDPLGQWLLRPLGPMQMPDWLRQDVQGLDDAPWTDWMQDLQALQDPFMLDVQRDPDNPNSFILRAPGDHDGGAQMEIRISETHDGARITLQRGADGRFTVERTDANGSTSARQFESAEALREHDPEAYKLFRRVSGLGSKSMITLPPALGDLPALRRDFQTRVEKAFRDSRARTDPAGRDAGATATSRSVSIRTGENGSIHVTVVRNGEKTEYEFDGPDSFRAREPELYEEFKGMFRR